MANTRTHPSSSLLSADEWVHVSHDPSPRQLSAAVLVNDSIYVIAGFDEESRNLNDFYEYNLGTGSWKQLPAPEGQGYHSASAVGYQDKIYVFGGCESGVEISEMRAYSLSKRIWKTVSQKNRPSPRWGHSAVIYKEYMILFGGTSNTVPVGDLHIYSFATKLWTEIQAKSINKPPARRYHTAVINDHYMYIYGGLANNKNLSDFWRLNLDTYAWEILPDGPATGRRGHVSINFLDRMIIHGGKQKEQSYGDTYEYIYEMRTWRQREDLETRNTYFHNAVVYSTTIFLFGGLVFSEADKKSHCSNSIIQLLIGGMPVTQKGMTKLLDSMINKYIFKYLSINQLLNFTSTCRRIYQISTTSKQWERMTREYLYLFHTINEKEKTPHEWKAYLMKKCIKYFQIMPIYTSEILEVRQNTDIKLAIFGAENSGKSKVCLQFILSTFDNETKPSIEDYYTKSLSVGGTYVNLHILDTVNTTQNRALQEQYLKDGQIFIIMYDITNTKSFQQVEQYYTTILKVKNSTHFPVLLVGNKADQESNRKVLKEHALLLARKHHMLFFESSALQNNKVKAIFLEIVWIVARIGYISQKHPQLLKNSTSKCLIM